MNLQLTHKIIPYLFILNLGYSNVLFTDITSFSGINFSGGSEGYYLRILHPLVGLIFLEDLKVYVYLTIIMMGGTIFFLLPEMETGFICIGMSKI